MPTVIAGFVKNGVVVPNAPLPEGAQVEIRLNDVAPAVPPELQEQGAAWQEASCCIAGMPAEGETVPAARLTPAELRRMPREQRQAIFAGLSKASCWRSERSVIVGLRQSAPSQLVQLCEDLIQGHRVEYAEGL